MIERTQPSPQELDHDAVLYGSDDGALVEQVVTFLAGGLQNGGAAIVIATALHERAIVAGLRALMLDDRDPALRDRLVFCDANRVLNSLFEGGRIESGRFDRQVGKYVQELASRYELRAYGEMVGILRAANDDASAVQLERLWNDLLGTAPFKLLCGYPIDVLDSEFTVESVGPIMCSHRNLTSTLAGFQTALDRAIDRAMGDRAVEIRRSLRLRMETGWATMPEVESTILWLRENMPAHADEIVHYAREHFAAEKAS